MNCNTTHYRANSSSVPGDPTPLVELNEVLLKACHKDLRQRYPSADAMLAELKLLQRGQSVQRRHAAERRFAFARGILAPVLLVAVLAGGGWYWFNSLAPRNSIQWSPAVNPARRAEAQKLYEEARTYSRGTKDGITKATELLNQAILADPDFAPAFGYLAQVNLEAAGWHVPPKQALTEAKKNAVRARLLDPSLAQAHLTLAQILFNLDRDWAGAEAEFKRAIELGPTNAWSYVLYGQMLSALGRFDDADAVLKRAQELDPTSQVVLAVIGWRYYQERRFADALLPAVKVRALYPNDPVSHQLYAFVQERLKNYPEALAAARRARQLDAVPDSIALVGFIQARVGQRAEAEKTLNELNAIAETRYVSPIFQAWLYAGLGEVDKIVECLQKAHEEIPLHPVLFQTDPKWDEVRDDPRFVEFVTKLGFHK